MKSFTPFNNSSTFANLDCPSTDISDLKKAHSPLSLSTESATVNASSVAALTECFAMRSQKARSFVTAAGLRP